MDEILDGGRFNPVWWKGGFVGVLGILVGFVVVKTWWDCGGLRGGCGVL